MISFERNQRKLETLKLFQAIYPGWMRPEAYAWKIGKLPTRAAYSYLKKLCKFGLLECSKEPVRYRITERGRERLAWLQQQL